LFGANFGTKKNLLHRRFHTAKCIWNVIISSGKRFERYVGSRRGVTKFILPPRCVRIQETMALHPSATVPGYPVGHVLADLFSWNVFSTACPPWKSRMLLLLDHVVRPWVTWAHPRHIALPRLPLITIVINIIIIIMRITLRVHGDHWTHPGREFVVKPR
jgi:hypothetical protein